MHIKPRPCRCRDNTGKPVEHLADVYDKNTDRKRLTSHYGKLEAVILSYVMKFALPTDKSSKISGNPGEIDEQHSVEDRAFATSVLGAVTESTHVDSPHRDQDFSVHNLGGTVDAHPSWPRRKFHHRITYCAARVK